MAQRPIVIVVVEIVRLKLRRGGRIEGGSGSVFTIKSKSFRRIVSSRGSLCARALDKRVYTNARAGTATRDLKQSGENLKPLFDLIVNTLPGPAFDPTASTQFQANNLDYNDYVGRLAIGRLKNGALAVGNYTLCRSDGAQQPVKVTQVFGWQG